MQAKGRTSLSVSNTSKFFLRIILPSLGLLSVDQISKTLALNFLNDRTIHLLGDFLTLRLARNTGAAFSIAGSSSILLGSFALAFLLVTIFLISKMERDVKEKNNRYWSYVAALVIGGLLGNVTDRLFRFPGGLRGSVVDWIALPHWPIFNCADISLVIAAVVATALTWRGVQPKLASKVR